MKPASFILSAFAACALAACGGNTGGNSNIGIPANPVPNPPANNYPAPQQPQAGATTHFDCDNGLGVNIRILNTSQIELRLDDKAMVMQNAVAGYGARYVSNSGLFGRGGEWHQKGMSEAFFAFTDLYGNAVETTCRSGVNRI